MPVRRPEYDTSEYIRNLLASAGPASYRTHSPRTVTGSAAGFSKGRACSPKAGSEEREVGNSAKPYSEQRLCPRRRATTVLLVKARLSPLPSLSYHSTVLLVLVDSTSGFALKVGCTKL
jgi:hypothetical protein